MITAEQLIQGGTSGVQSSGSLDQPLDHLVACHRRIEQRLETLQRVTPHLASRREEALAAIDSCLEFFNSNGAWHTADEEQSIFPRLDAHLSPDERKYVAELETQHDEAEALYDKLLLLVGQMKSAQPIPPVLIESYGRVVADLAAIYRPHIASEDKVLTEIGRRLLSGAALAEISAEMKRRRGLTAG